MHPRRAIGLTKGRVDLRSDITELRLADAAVKARATRRHPRQHHAVAFLQMLDSFAEALDDARPLVAENARKFRRHDSGDDRKVGMADPAGGHSHQNFVSLRRVEGNLFHAHGLVVLVTDSCPQ